MKLSQFIKKHTWYYVNPNLTDENFPAPKGEVSIEGAQLLPLTKWMSGPEVVAMLKEKKLRGATIHELVAYFDAHKDELKGTGKWYRAFGSGWIDSGGYRRVLGVSAVSDGGFSFYLDRFAYDWFDDYVLLVFSDKSSDAEALGEFGSSDTLTLESLSARVKDLEAWKEKVISIFSHQGV